MRKLRVLIPVLALLASVFVMAVPALAATCSVPTVYPTIASAAADGTCTVIDIAAGTYAESGIVFTTAGVTVQGAGPGSTIVDPGGSGNVFLPRADDQTYKDLTIQSGTQAMRFELALGTIDNTEINNVEFLGNSSRGIEIHNDTTVTNLRVLDSLFDNDNIGIRFASSGSGDGLYISGTTFSNNVIGLYEANDGFAGNLHDLHVWNSDFTDNSYAGIYGEEIRDSLIETSDFTGNRFGFYLWKAYTGAGVPADNITLGGNTFTNQTEESILLALDVANGSGPLSVVDNTFDVDVGAQAVATRAIELETFSGDGPYGPIVISGNNVTLSGSFTGGANASYGIGLRGSTEADVTIENNTLDGGSVGNGGGVPPTSGIYLVTDDDRWGLGTTSPSAYIHGTFNAFDNFVNGVSVYDPVVGSFGALPTGATLSLTYGQLTGNSGLGAANDSTVSETADLTCNWWGAANGPSGPAGSGSGDGVSANVEFSAWLTDVAGVCNGGTPNGLKEVSITTLQSVLPTGDDKADKKIEKAIERLEKSLTAEWWVDDSTLDAKDGDKVFKEEEKAVKELTKKETEGNATAQAVVQALLTADEALAQAAIDAAVGGDAKKIEKANEEMAKAFEEIGKGKFDKAVEHFRKAWENAQKAMP